MEEQQLFTQFSQLKQKTTPRQAWVFSLRQQILQRQEADVQQKEAARVGLFVRLRETLFIVRTLSQPAFVISVLTLVILGGVFVNAASRSLPGDRFYAVRSALEVAGLSLQEERTLMHFELAQRRLEDLRHIAAENQVKNLHPTIQEVEGRIAEASRSVAELVEKDPDRALQAGREIVKLEKAKTQVEQVLGAAIGAEESEGLRNAAKALVELELGDLESRSLTDAQADLLQQVRAHYEQGAYERALEIILRISGE